LTETASAADYDRFAAEFLANAEASVARMRPAGEIAVFLWRGTWRVGAVQPLGYETVALVSVNSEPLEDWVPEALRRARPGLRELTIDPQLEVRGQLNVARVEGNYVGIMTPTQTWWACRNVGEVKFTNG
jgi:hypothetical protein